MTASNTPPAASKQQTKYDPYTDKKLETKQKTLSLLTHAANCKVLPKDCTNKQCKAAKTMLQHIVKCKEVKCEAPFCAFAKFVLRHGPQIKKASDELAAKRKNVMVVGGIAQKPNPKRYRHIYHCQRLRPAITTPTQMPGSFQSVCHQLNVSIQQGGRPLSKKKRAKMKRKSMPVLHESKREEKYNHDEEEESTSGSEFSSSSEEATINFDEEDSSSEEYSTSSSSDSDDDETMEKADVFREDALFKAMEKDRQRLRRGSLSKLGDPVKAPIATTTSALALSSLPKAKKTVASSRDQGPRVPSRSYVSDSDNSSSSSSSSSSDSEDGISPENVISVPDRSDCESSSSASEEKEEEGQTKSKNNNNNAVSKASKIINKAASTTGEKRGNADSSSDESSSEEEEDKEVTPRDSLIKSASSVGERRVNVANSEAKDGDTTREKKDTVESSSDDSSSSEDEDQWKFTGKPAVTAAPSKRAQKDTGQASSLEAKSKPSKVSSSDVGWHSLSIVQTASDPKVDELRRRLDNYTSKQGKKESAKDSKDSCTALNMWVPPDVTSLIASNSQKLDALDTTVTDYQDKSDSETKGAKWVDVQSHTREGAIGSKDSRQSSTSTGDVAAASVWAPPKETDISSLVEAADANIQNTNNKGSGSSSMALPEKDVQVTKGPVPSGKIVGAPKVPPANPKATKNRDDFSIDSTCSEVSSAVYSDSSQSELHEERNEMNESLISRQVSKLDPNKNDGLVSTAALSVPRGGSKKLRNEIEGKTDLVATENPVNDVQYDSDITLSSRKRIEAKLLAIKAKCESMAAKILKLEDTNKSIEDVKEELVQTKAHLQARVSILEARLQEALKLIGSLKAAKAVLDENLKAAFNEPAKVDASVQLRRETQSETSRQIADKALEDRSTSTPVKSKNIVVANDASLAQAPETKKQSIFANSDSDSSDDQCIVEKAASPETTPLAPTTDGWVRLTKTSLVSKNDDSRGGRDDVTPTQIAEEKTMQGDSVYGRASTAPPSTPSSALLPKKNAFLDDSDSDDSASSSNEDATTTTASKPSLALIPKMSSFLDDSSNSKFSSKHDKKAQPARQARKKSFLDDSDSDSNSSSHSGTENIQNSSKNKANAQKVEDTTSKTRSPLTLAKTEVESKHEQPKQPMNDITAQWKPMQASGALIANDSGKEKEQEKIDSPAPKPSLDLIPKKRSFLDDSDSDDSNSSSEHDKKTLPRKKSFLHDSDSDSDSHSGIDSSSHIGTENIQNSSKKDDATSPSAKTEVESKQEQPKQSMNDIIAQWKTQQAAGVLVAKEEDKDKEQKKDDKPAKAEVDSKQEQPKQSMNDIIAQWKTQQAAGVLVAKEEDKDKEQKKDDKPAKAEVDSKQEQPKQSMNDIIAQWKTQQAAGVLVAKDDDDKDKEQKKDDSLAKTEVESKQEQPKQSMDDIIAQWKTKQTAGVLVANDDDKEKEQEKDEKPAQRKWKTSAYTPMSYLTPSNRRKEDVSLADSQAKTSSVQHRWDKGEKGANGRFHSAGDKTSSDSDKAPVGQRRWGNRTNEAASTARGAWERGEETSDAPMGSNTEPFNRWKSPESTVNKSSWKTAPAMNVSNASNSPSKTSVSSQVPAWKAKLKSVKTATNSSNTSNAPSPSAQVPAWKAKLMSAKYLANGSPQSSNIPGTSTQASQSRSEKPAAQRGSSQNSAFANWKDRAGKAEPSKVAPPPKWKPATKPRPELMALSKPKEPLLVEASKGEVTDDSDDLDWWKMPSNDDEWWSAGDPDYLEKLVLEALELDD